MAYAHHGHAHEGGMFPASSTSSSGTPTLISRTTSPNASLSSFSSLPPPSSSSLSAPSASAQSAYYNHGHSHGHGHGHGHDGDHGSDEHNHSHHDSFHSAYRSYRVPKSVKLLQVIAAIIRFPRASRFLWFLLANTLLAGFHFYISTTSESHAFLSLSVLSLFHTLAIAAHTLTFWALAIKADEFRSFGMVRVEALAFFTVGILTLLGAIVCLKESGEHILHNRDNDFLEEPVPVHMSVFVALILGLVCQLWFSILANSTVLFKGTIRSFGPRAVPFLSALSSTIQEKNVHTIGGLSSYACVILVYLIISFDARAHALDPMAAVFAALWLLCTVLPVCITNALILLQTAPMELVGPLEKCLREVGTIDGVLEYGSEHFWTLAHDTIVGSLVVRVRREANEQQVLAHVLAKFAALIPARNMTVQIIKDDFVVASLSRKPQLG